MDIYKNSLKYAKENGELERYRESMNLCDECGTFISHSIAENFNNNYLDVKKVTAEAAGKYGFERALLMLALRVDSLKYDWRFTADNFGLILCILCIQIVRLSQCRGNPENSRQDARNGSPGSS